MNNEETTASDSVPAVVMPPEGTTIGYRSSDGSMWRKCWTEPEHKPGIAICEHPGNWVTPPCYKRIAVFESEADRDFVLRLHAAFIADGG